MPREFFSLDDILQDDDEGLLPTRARSRGPSQSHLAVRGFEEISAFVDAHERPPAPDGPGREAQLARRLTAILRSPERVAMLAPYDRHGLLEGSAASVSDSGPGNEPCHDPSENVTSLDDIFSDDDGLLDGGCDDIFEARHIRFDARKNLPDEIAQRKPCEEFWRFESLFRELREEIESGTSKTERFKRESYVEEGDFFILDGILSLVDWIGEKDEGAGDRHNPRIRVIFDNGTESNMLLLSFTRALYKDRNGRRVLRDRDRALDKLRGVTHHDERKGTIYILRSLSTNPELAGVGDLYKIGYTEEALSKRIAGAERSSTYLEAPVQVVATYEVYNANPRAIERLIHAMLAPQRLHVTLRDADGRRYRPREWFCVPLETAKGVVERIADGTIKEYRIDTTSGKLVKKTRQYQQG